MARKCEVCSNGHLEQINKILAKPKPPSFRLISSQVYGTDKHYRSIARHAEHLGYDFQVAIKEQRILEAVDVHKEFCEQLDFAKKLREASQNWLTINSEITLDLRDDEINVVYLDWNNCEKGKPARETEDLSSLLKRLERGNNEAIKVTSKRVDLRSFALDAIKTCDLVIDKFAKLGGDYQTDRTNDADRKRELEFKIKEGAANNILSWLADSLTSINSDDPRVTEFQALVADLQSKDWATETLEAFRGMDDDELQAANSLFQKGDGGLLNS